MTFSVNLAWMRNGALAPELSFSLSAVIPGKREPFWSFPGKFDSVRFQFAPHFRLEWTITVRNDWPAGTLEQETKRAKPVRRPRSLYRPVRTNPYAFACCWRL